MRTAGSGCLSRGTDGLSGVVETLELDRGDSYITVKTKILIELYTCKKRVL